MRLPNGDIYLDYNATTPIDPQVLEGMEPYQSLQFGNPSSNHTLGRVAKRAIESAREQVSRLIQCKPEEIIFTSGGSESNNMAIKGIAASRGGRGQHIVVSHIEHPAILDVVNYLQHHGYRITYLPVDGQGVVSIQELQDIITSKTILVSVMHANNEVGTIQPVSEISEIAHRAGAVVHSDAAQSLGKVPVDVDQLGCDLLSLAGHKFYAPKGVGALYKKADVDLVPLIHGADHEDGLRAGTENVAQIVGLGLAAQIAAKELEKERARIQDLRDRLQYNLKKAFPEMRVNAGNTSRLPNTLSISFAGTISQNILESLENVMVSAGAACHSGAKKGSGVLEAMHIPLEYQTGTIRISLGRFCDEAIVADASRILIEKISALLDT